ncbi:hypothetical protein chiPu_0033587, partial [Chiloscyllium punctatum]|nr:hypothetical protein [Chiloscyllium punctatum]
MSVPRSALARARRMRAEQEAAPTLTGKTYASSAIASFAIPRSRPR